MPTALLLLPTVMVPTCFWPRNLKNPVLGPRNISYAPLLTLLQPTGLLAIVQMLQAHSHLRAFALAVSLVWTNPS